MTDKITTETIGKNIAKVEEDFILEETPMTRLIFRAQIHTGGIRGKIIRQRRTRKDTWTSDSKVDIRSLSPGQGINILLRTGAVLQFNEALDKLKSLLEQQGVEYGRNQYVTTRADQVIVTDVNKAHYIKELIEKGYSIEIWGKLIESDPSLATKLSLSRIYEERKQSLKEFEENIKKQLGEEHWQQFLKENRWIFGNSYIGRIGERRINIKSTLDHPLITEDGFLEIVEIKTPEFPFWKIKRDGTYALYRGKYLVPHQELEGGITQGSHYILEAEKEIDSKSWAESHEGIYPLKPKCLVVHGRSKNWGEQEAEAYRLLSDRLHGINIITFDHLLLRVKQTLELFNPNKYD